MSKTNNTKNAQPKKVVYYAALAKSGSKPPQYGWTAKVASIDWARADKLASDTYKLMGSPASLTPVVITKEVKVS